MGNLHSSHPRHRKLPAELNQQIFLCFKPLTQRKFIYGLGWDFYAMFRQKLLTKTNRVCNPNRNSWKSIITETIVGRNNNIYERTNLFAGKGFAISGKHFRVDSFPGTIIYYYEVNLLSKSRCRIGLSNVTPAAGKLIGQYPNSYAIAISTNYHNAWCECDLATETHYFRWTDEAIRPKLRDNGRDVCGCGIVMDPNDKLAIFFTLNGILLGRQIPISPSVDVEHLFPAVRLCFGVSSVEVNFGTNKDKPFKYDVKKCSGMGLACISEETKFGKNL